MYADSPTALENTTHQQFFPLSLSFHTPPHILSACTQRLHPILFALSAFECEKRFSAADDIGAAGVGKRMGLMHFFIRQISTVAALSFARAAFLCSSESIAPLFYSLQTTSSTAVAESASLVLPLCSRAGNKKGQAAVSNGMKC
jgi:hypothetical protein